MTTLGTIGSGKIGGTVAKLAARAGYDVVLSNSRGPETLKDLVDEIGWDALDAGTLADSWRFQPDTPAYGVPYFGGRGWSMDDPGSPTGADVIRAALDRATR